MLYVHTEGSHLSSSIGNLTGIPEISMKLPMDLNVSFSGTFVKRERTSSERASLSNTSTTSIPPANLSASQPQTTRKTSLSTLLIATRYGCVTNDPGKPARHLLTLSLITPCRYIILVSNYLLSSFLDLSFRITENLYFLSRSTVSNLGTHQYRKHRNRQIKTNLSFCVRPSQLLTWHIQRHLYLNEALIYPRDQLFLDIL